ncbi:hypothetical protein IGI04_003017 [Brassica rapa subsp. trilocularis]|uniref:Uncharacterized protein n=1 Tax=Brassica rapa subsp. trilocularis TaxID=1813537 RepID=A0ABQ7NZ85_BRACM|nr:hypothetical protein IGI04_003017 [Brassica rapa subsp. trilocularis]
MTIRTRKNQARSLCNYRTCTLFGRYVATELEPKPGRYVPLGHYVATELESKFGHYIATERSSRSRPSVRPPRSLCSNRARSQARSLRNDRASVPLGRYVATEHPFRSIGT